MNSKVLFRNIVDQVRISDNPSEIESIVYILLEHLGGLTKEEILRGSTIDINHDLISNALARINSNEPVQYITEEAFFFRKKFKVNTAVLIPRPETEILVHELTQSYKNPVSRILDIGTGSGCIAITLALQYPQAEVIAVDISERALAVATQNQLLHQAENVHFHKLDILNQDISFSNIDLLISNPPYIPWLQSKTLQKNITSFEPEEALFVPDDDPLLFYRAIANMKEKISPSGQVWVEIHEDFGEDVAQLFYVNGFTKVNIIKDLDNKDRIVSASIH